MLTSSQCVKTVQFCMPFDTEIAFILIQTPNQIIFEPHTKPSQSWSLHWNQVNFAPPHWNTSISSTNTTKSIAMPNWEPCHFGPCHFGYYTFQHMFIWYSGNTWNMITTINSYYSWRIHTAVKPRNYCVSIYTIFYFLLHGIYKTTRDTGGRTSVRSISFGCIISWCHI